MIEKYDLLNLTNQFDYFLAKRGMVPQEYFQTFDGRVAVCTNSLSDMMELKKIALRETIVYVVESGSETRLGAMVTLKEKEDYYSELKKSMIKKRKDKKMKRVKKQKAKEEEEPIKEDL